MHSCKSHGNWWVHSYFYQHGFRGLTLFHLQSKFCQIETLKGLKSILFIEWNFPNSFFECILRRTTHNWGESPRICSFKLDSSNRTKKTIISQSGQKEPSVQLLFVTSQKGQ